MELNLIHIWSWQPCRYDLFYMSFVVVADSNGSYLTLLLKFNEGIPLFEPLGFSKWSMYQIQI